MAMLTGPGRPLLAILLFLALSGAGPASAAPLDQAISVPEGYRRKAYPAGSYSRFLQTLPLKAGAGITGYHGRPIRGFDVLAVADIPLLFPQNLEQCADFAMRLWAEYHKRAGTLDRFYLFDYNGNRRDFSASEKTFVAFLKWSFSNTNSHSLKRGCAKVASEQELVPGDMLVQNEDGGIGHVSVILDVCERPGKPRLYLMGFSYMPAQEFHVERATGRRGEAGWFTLAGFKDYLEETLPYGPPVFRRFGP